MFYVFKVCNPTGTFDIGLNGIHISDEFSHAVKSIQPGSRTLSYAYFRLRAYFRVPTAQAKQGKQGKWPKKNPCQGKHRELGNFAKTQGILFAQVVNSLMPKVKDIVIFAAKISIFFQKLDRSAKSVLCM